MYWWVGIKHMKHVQILLNVITYALNPLCEYDPKGKNYDHNTTILDSKLRLKHDWYVKIKKINMTSQEN